MRCSLRHCWNLGWRMAGGEGKSGTICLPFIAIGTSNELPDPIAAKKVVAEEEGRKEGTQAGVNAGAEAGIGTGGEQEGAPAGVTAAGEAAQAMPVGVGG